MLNRSFIRLKEISKMTNISTATLRNYIKKGMLHGVLIGNNYYVASIDYDKFVYRLYGESLGLDPERFTEALSKLREEDKNKMMDYSYDHYNSLLK